jgi:large subunit ribosomal protein L28
MARRCSVNSNKGVKVGNNVSHSNRKTKRRYLPNLQFASFFSDVLKRKLRLRVSTNSIRSIEHNDGIDQFLLNASPENLSRDALLFRKQIASAKQA